MDINNFCELYVIRKCRYEWVMIVLNGKFHNSGKLDYVYEKPLFLGQNIWLYEKLLINYSLVLLK